MTALILQICFEEISNLLTKMLPIQNCNRAAPKTLYCAPKNFARRSKPVLLFLILFPFYFRIPLISSFRNPGYDQSDSAGEPIVSKYLKTFHLMVL